jgi:hypothetical protein
VKRSSISSGAHTAKEASALALTLSLIGTESTSSKTSTTAAPAMTIAAATSTTTERARRRHSSSLSDSSSSFSHSGGSDSSDEEAVVVYSLPGDPSVPPPSKPDDAPTPSIEDDLTTVRAALAERRAALQLVRQEIASESAGDASDAALERRRRLERLTSEAAALDGLVRASANARSLRDRSLAFTGVRTDAADAKPNNDEAGDAGAAASGGGVVIVSAEDEHKRDASGLFAEPVRACVVYDM